MRPSIVLHPLTVKEPMVLVPVGVYRLLLSEAGYLPTPKLDRTIAQARARFRKGRVIPWEHVIRAGDRKDVYR